jgi:hypothetical protein
MVAINNNRKSAWNSFPTSSPGNLSFTIQDCLKLFCSASVQVALVIAFVVTPLFLFLYQWWYYSRLLPELTYDSCSRNPDSMNTCLLHITLDLTRIQQQLLARWTFKNSKLLEKLLCYRWQSTQKTCTLNAWVNSICSLDFVWLGRELSFQPYNQSLALLTYFGKLPALEVKCILDTLLVNASASNLQKCNWKSDRKPGI